MLVGVGDCCPPVLRSIDGLRKNVSVLLLAPIGEPPPEVMWAVLSAQPEPRRPSALQVLEGKDGDGNAVVSVGSTSASPAQANHWLQTNSFDRVTYSYLLHQKQLYFKLTPYEVSFTVSHFELYGAMYRVHVAAQNPRTRALAAFTVMSDVIVTSVCGEHCEDCGLTRRGVCHKCAPGTRRTRSGHCVPCVAHCKRCNEVELNEHRMVLSSQVPCDYDGCGDGFGITPEGHCTSCGVKNCARCDIGAFAMVGKCQQCMDGYGLYENRTCGPCAHQHCKCKMSAECDLCDEGWGLASNGTCLSCETGCNVCIHAHGSGCMQCKIGFAAAGLTCRRCPLHCFNCTKSGYQGCDECLVGFGYNSIAQECQRCVPSKCLECNGQRLGKCLRCMKGYGVTPEGLCQKCGVFCEQCDLASKCSLCQAGYAVSEGACWSCGDGCASCTNSGPARCDKCLPGFLETETKLCAPLVTAHLEM